MDSIAVYLHWPWCAAICPYCDFDKQASDFGLADAYIEAMLTHLAMEPRRRVHSVYFGGGTPSLLRPDRLARLMDGLRDRMEVAADAEVTLEANPSDVVAHKIEAYQRAGVNRISLGVQSLIDLELRFLGRRHDAAKAVKAVEALRAAGCENFSLDLIYGLPGQGEDEVRRSVEGLLGLEPAHLSCYALTLEEGTPFGDAEAAGRLAAEDDDVVAERYGLICELAEGAGFGHYEVSNWARSGWESVHNLTYWRNGEWLGLGAGAAGSIGGVRY
jgi:oxygen-independent coproporphyrinogen-3 oxidase